MLLFGTIAQAQFGPSPWKKGAPFPEPDEELYGVVVNGKLYVIGGWGEGKARGVTYEYDPPTDKWTKKTSMPLPAHHAALAAYNGKIYVCGGFVAGKSPCASGPLGNHRQRLGHPAGRLGRLPLQKLGRPGGSVRKIHHRRRRLLGSKRFFASWDRATF
jgi:hypothetical protein